MDSAGPRIAVDASVRSSLCLAVDSDDLIAADRLVRSLTPYFGVVKVGPVLWASAGPKCVANFMDHGCEVFADLKLHDTPEIVEGTARVLGSLGVSYVTMHARGGLEMLRGGVAGLAKGADNAGVPRPASIAVTVLASDTRAPDHLVPNRLRVAMEAGCDGVVCSVRDLGWVHSLAPRMLAVATGIDMYHSSDDPTVSTPLEAHAGGADLLVLGSAITAAPDPELAAVSMVSQLERQRR